MQTFLGLLATAWLAFVAGVFLGRRAGREQGYAEGYNIGRSINKGDARRPT